MMAAEGPFLAAVIARLAEPKFNLAAYGVAYSFGVLIEAPIIMIMSASTALVHDRDSYLKLRNFTFVLNGICTLIMIIFILPPLFFFIVQQLIGLPPNIARITHQACIALLVWPGSIGYRRFYQGLLIRNNLTRRVAYGTVIRLSTMASASLVCYFFFHLDGALVGTLSLSLSVTAEAIAVRLMVHKTVKELLSRYKNIQENSRLSYRYISKFYFPLALTSILSLGVHPIVTFFMGQSRMPIESLAVLPVINSLVFIFRSVGLSFQEVGIALMGDHNSHFNMLRNFAMVLGLAVVAALGILAFSPLSFIWFNKISGLTLELTNFARFPTQILSVLPGLTVLVSFQRAILVKNAKTTAITIATSIEVLTIFSLLFLTTVLFNFVGAVAAALAILTGRICANGYLFFPCKKVLTKEGK
jgi:O-antigen/teichoic acid export membrane protein